MPNRPRPRDLILGMPAAALAGLLVGALGTFKHHVGVGFASREGFPLGLVLSLAMVLVLLAAVRLSLPSRLFAAAAAAGIVAAVGLLTLPGPSGGSTVVLGDPVGSVWTVGAVLVAAAVVAAPLRRRGAREADGILDTDPRREDLE